MDNNVKVTPSRSRFNVRTLVGLGLLTAIVIVLQFIGAAIRFGTFSVSLVLMPIVVGAALYGVGAGAWLGLVFGVVVLLSGDANTFLAINPFGTVVTVILKGVLAGTVSGLVYTWLAKLFSRSLTVERLAVVLTCCILLIGGAVMLYFGIKLKSAPVDPTAEAVASPAVYLIIFGIVLLVVGIALIAYELIKKPDLDMSAAVFAAAAVCPIVNTGIFLLGCRLFFFDTIKEWAGGTNVGTFMIVGLVGLNFIFELAVNLILSPAIVILIRFGEKSIAKRS